MALATGSQHMNLLAPASGAAPSADGAQAAPAVTVQSGSTASSFMLTATDAAKFAPGSMVAVDVDYTGQTGYVGAPVAAHMCASRLPMWITSGASHSMLRLVLGVSCNEPDAGGAFARRCASSGRKATGHYGFVDREGGSFYQEWSALFVMQGSQGERIFFHYPRLQSMAGAEESAIPLDSKHKGGLARILLKGQFLALPVTDPLDGERVLCYRSFLPAATR